jgi:hypothetical protein
MMLERPSRLAEHEYLIYAENKVSEILAPWFTLNLLKTTGGRIIIHLRSLFTHDLYKEDPCVVEFTPIAVPVSQCLEIARVLALDEYLEIIRGAILKGQRIDPHLFLSILPFKEFLESGGDPRLMPVVKTGCRDRRELTKLGAFQSGRMRCKKGCPCPRPQIVSEMERKLEFQLSNEVNARRERRTISEFFEFNNLEELKGISGISQSRLELFTRLCRR